MKEPIVPVSPTCSSRSRSSSCCSMSCSSNFKEEEQHVTSSSAPLSVADNTIIKSNAAADAADPPTNDDDDDASLALLDPDDFDRSTWSQMIYQNIDPPLLPLAVIAAATVLLNPLLFIAGAAMAASAVGAVHMIHHGYDWLFNNTNEEQPQQEGEQGATSVTTCTTTTPTTVAPTTTSIPPRWISQQILPPQSTTTSSNSSNHTRKEGDDDDEVEEDEAEDPTAVSDHFGLEQYFPPLPDVVVEGQNFQGLNAVEFFNVYFGDDAPYTFCEFQKQRGDIDIVYGRWKKQTTTTTTGGRPTAATTTKQHLSSCQFTNDHTEVMVLSPIMDDDEPTRNMETTKFFTCMERCLEFKTLNKSYFGPPYATVIKTQRCFLHKRLLILESHVSLKNVPFCNCFYVLERWIVSSQNKSSTTLSVYSQVIFLQPCAFEAQIRSKSACTLREIVTSWCDMAQRALQLTIQQKLQRQEHNNNMSTTTTTSSSCDEVSIEVQHSDDNKSFVVGEEENVAPTMMMQVTLSPNNSKSQQQQQPLSTSWRRSVLQRMVRKSSKSVEYYYNEE